MLVYIVKRILYFIPTLLIISIVAFGLSKLAPGDPVDCNLAQQGEGGIEDIYYYEQIYAETSREMGLDLPNFYFSFTAKAYPDTLYRIYQKEKREIQQKLIAQYGNWNEINAYYQQIRTLELARFNVPDTLAQKEQILLKQTLAQLYYSYKDARIESLLKKIEKLIPSLKEKNVGQGTQMETILGEPINNLIEKYKKVKQKASPNQLLIPVLRWNGFQNQYHQWLSRFVSGDFGKSCYDKRPVFDKIKEACWWTLMMNLVSIFLAYLLSIPLGVFSAVKRGTLYDRIIGLFLFLLFSLPGFWLATMLVIFFTTPEYGMNWFASVGLGSISPDDPLLQRIWVRSMHLILPIFCITYGTLAFISRQVRGGMLDVIQQDFVRTARAKGLKEKWVVWKHGFRNALFPLITMFASIFRRAVAGSVVIEVIFNIPGMGRLLFNSIFAKDWPIVFTVLLVMAFLTLLGNLIADILYGLADPRVSFKGKK